MTKHIIYCDRCGKEFSLNDHINGKYLSPYKPLKIGVTSRRNDQFGNPEIEETFDLCDGCSIELYMFLERRTGNEDL